MNILQRIDRLESRLNVSEANSLQSFWRRFREQYNELPSTDKGAEAESLIVESVSLEFCGGPLERERAKELHDRASALLAEAAEQLGYSDLAAWILDNSNNAPLVRS